MRDESEMMRQILQVAQEDGRVQAVWLGGSRTDPQARPDLLQDYDVVYVVEETRSFRQDPQWAERQFGPVLYCQRPEELDASLGQEADLENNFGWLMQLADGNCLDLHVQTLKRTLQELQEERLSRVLWDRDGVLPPLPEPSDCCHWVRRPSPQQYAACCNEFWWCLNNLGKGLWHREVTYSQEVLSCQLRPQLVTMLGWESGVRCGFSHSIGKAGKGLERWARPEDWQDLLATYCGPGWEEMCCSARVICRVFDRTARRVGEGLGYPYRQEEARASWDYLEHLLALPVDAKQVF